MMSNPVSRLMSALVLLSASLPVALAQTSTANLTGLISDPAGASIPAVRLRLENTATRETRETTSGNEGRSTFSQILPGT
jgi:hypothetical protein